MEYKDFYILKKSKCLYWIIANGFMVGSADSISHAKEYIDKLNYCEE